MKAEAHPQTSERVAFLHAASLLDGPRDPAFADLATLASTLCGMPIALVTLLDSERQVFKATVGVEAESTPIEHSICAHTVLEHDLLEIPDTAADPRTAANPFCQGAGAIRFYAGAVVRSPQGVPLGTICVLDVEPRQLQPPQRQALLTLARQVGRLIELHRALDAERTLAREVDHRTKNSLQLVSSFLRLQRRRARAEPEVAAALAAAERRVDAIGALHEELYQSGSGHEVDLALLLARVCGALRPNLPAGVTLSLDLEPLMLPSHKAAAAGLIVNEFATNSVKHAFPSGNGTITVNGRAVGADYHLVLADDGIGMPPGTGSRTGLGLDIIEAASHQLAAEPLVLPAARNGTRLALRLPAERPAMAARAVR